MKSLFTTVCAFSMILIIFISEGFAQAPEGIKYQAVARDASGNVMDSENMTVRIGIYEGAGATIKVYEETQNITTNQFGLINLIIGDGSTTVGNFSNIDWGNNEHHLKVEINTGSGYVDMGTNELQSVPYSLYAKEAGSVGNMDIDQLTDVDVSGVNNGQVLKWNGTEWKPSDDEGLSTVNTDATLDGDGTAANNLRLAQQSASLGEVLKWDGSSWTPDTDNNTTYSAGTGLNLSGTIFAAQNSTAMWNAHELQGNAISTTSPSSGQVLKWNGTSWAPASDNSGGSYTAGTGINISGNTITNTDPDQAVSITGSGATSVSGTYPHFTISSTDNNTTYSAGTGLNLSGTTFDAQNSTAIWNANELQGNAISSNTPAVDDILRWDGNAWVPEVNTDTSLWEKNGFHLFTESDSVGIGTDLPLAALHVEVGQDVLFGDTTAGSSLNSRFMWIADRGALRAGRANSANWDFDSIGFYSVAFGYNTKASGDFSTAMGYNTTASGTIYSTAMGEFTTASGSSSMAMGGYSTASGGYSTAMGFSTTASGTSSTAMGESTTASGTNSTAMGYLTTASGLNSTAMGRSTTASMNNTTAMGTSTTASGDYATALGRSTIASGLNSTAMGYSTTASQWYSTAMGSSTIASGRYTTAMGNNTEAPSGYETVVGRFNTSYTPQSTTSWNSNDRLFVIGNGTSSIYKSDAMVVLKNGNIGIGNSNPGELLHVGTTTGARIQIGSVETIEDDGGNRLALNSHITPVNDGYRNLGTGSKRWGAVYAQNGTINTSDAREKTNIQPIAYGLETVMALNPITFQWKDSDRPEEKLGLVAQELQEVVPEVVVDQEFVITDESTGEGHWKEAEKLGVYYNDLIPVLTKAIQEQQEQIEQQEQEIANGQVKTQELEEKVEEQEEQILMLKKQLMDINERLKQLEED